MKKILALIVILAAVWAIPVARQNIGAAALPLLNKLGPVGESIANPVRNFQAKNQAAFFLRILNDDVTEGRQLPDPRRFGEWMLQRTPREEHLDPWGNPYWMRRSGRSTVTIGSNGADGVRDTDDDVTDTATF